MAEITISVAENVKTSTVRTSSGKALWEFPWLYKESFLVASGLLIIGFILEFTSGGAGVRALFWPYNVLFGVFFIAISVGVRLVLTPTHPVIKWITSVPASLSAIGLLFLMVVLLGLIPQVENSETAEWIRRLGLTHITSSWPFIIALLYLLATLQFAIIKRVYPFTLKNVAFFINHAGLWLALFAGFLGTGDFKRLRMDLYEGEINWQAKDEHNRLFNIPLAFNLSKFDIEEYNPKLLAVSRINWEIQPSTANMTFVIEQGAEGNLSGWDVKVEKYFSGAMRNGGVFLESSEKGSAPAAYIKAINLADNSKSVEGWVSCGSFINKPEMLNLTDELALAMGTPEPKKFSSQVRAYTHDGTIEDITLEVNKPHVIGGWKVYQVSYDDRFGKWSQLSVIELIRDPWLPVVYTGIFMMIAGAVYLMYIGKD